MRRQERRDRRYENVALPSIKRSNTRGSDLQGQRSGDKEVEDQVFILPGEPASCFPGEGSGLDFICIVDMFRHVEV